MHLKNFPKRLDSKTSSLRITVPENLDLALEGLIRKVLREQPKTDYIHSFAAEYFETLLKIRDKAGAKYTAEQLCPFHNDEDAHEMIKLANTFNKPSKKSRKESPQGKDKMAESGVSGRRPKVKQGKQATPDLIKKLPGNRPKDKKKESEKENREVELLTGDPIKELVEKELEMEALAKKTKTESTEGDNGRSEATEEKKITDDAEEPTEGDETVKIPGAEETVVKEEHPPDETETKKTEETSVEEKPSTADKDSGMTDSAAEEETAVKRDVGDKQPPDEMEEKTVEDKLPKEDINSEATAEVRNGGGGNETALEEEKDENGRKTKDETGDEEKEVENSPRQIITGNDGSGPQPEEKSNSAKEDKAEEVQEKSETETKIEGEEPKVEEKLRTESATAEATDERKIDAENADQEQKQQEVGVEQKQQEATVEQKEQEPGMEQKKPEEELEQKQQEHEVEQKEQEATREEQESVMEQKKPEATVKQKEQEPGEEQKMPEPGKEHKQQEMGVEPKQHEQEVAQKQQEPGVKKEQLEPEIQQDQQEQGVEQKEPEAGLEEKQQEGTLKQKEQGMEQKKPEATVEQKEEEPRVEQKILEPVEEQKQEPGVKKQQPEPEIQQTQQEPGVEQKQLEQEMEQKQPEATIEHKEQEPGVEQKIPEPGEEQKEQEIGVKKKEQPEKQKMEDDKQPKTGNTSESEQKNSESEGKTPTEDLTQEQTETEPHSSEKTETAKPEQKDKSETKEEVIASEENALTAEAEEMTPTAEEMPSKEDEPGHKKDDTEVDLDRPEQRGKDDGSKADATVTEEPLKVPEDETAVREEAGKDEGEKSGDAEEVEDASPSTNDTAAVEKPEEPQPQADTKPEVQEIQNEKQKDELSTTVDVQQGTTEDEQTDDTKQPEEELCTVVDSHHIIRIEEPEPAPDDPGVAPPPEEVQIKTIQTHYYDALKVPEILTKEFRVHNVGAAMPEEPARVGENSSGPAEAAAKVEENSGTAEDAAKVGENNRGPAEGAAKVEENSGTAEDAAKVGENNRGQAEDTQMTGERAETGDSAEKHPDDVSLLVTAPGQQELAPDSVRSDDLLDLMTPTSGYSLNLSELSWQTVSGLFLDSERQHSSQLSDELRYKTVIGKPEERDDEIEEVFHRTVVPTLVGAVPMPPRDADEIDKEEDDDSSPEEKKENKKKLEDVSNGKSFDSDTPFISVEVKTVIETQILDDEDEEEGRPRMELMVQATIDVEDVEETTKRQQNLPEGEEKDMSEGQDKGGSGESDSTMSSAVTEIKRSDSGRRGGSLMQSQSLDLGGRNPLLRTRSLSTFRHGVTDFEVWNAIEKELEDAATKIQTRFRSYKARKRLQREDAVQITTEESSASSSPADDQQQSTGEFHDSIVLSDHPR